MQAIIESGINVVGWESLSESTSSDGKCDIAIINKRIDLDRSKQSLTVTRKMLARIAAHPASFAMTNRCLSVSQSQAPSARNFVLGENGWSKDYTSSGPWPVTFGENGSAVISPA